MAKAHQKKKNKKVQKYVNPTSVPSKKKIIITEDDPRNTELYIRQSNQNYEIVEVNDFDYIPEQDVSEDFWDESSDPSTYFEDQPYLETPLPTRSMDGAPFETGITPPTNLYIDPNSFTLEDSEANSDGALTWTAYLYFDDVENAEDYEYVIGAKE